MAERQDLQHENDLITRILVGEARLFHELIRPYERTVYGMALSFMHNEADAEDVAQEAFLNAYRNLGSFRGDAKFGTWLISITLNEARTRLRKAANSTTQSLDTAPHEEGHVSPALLRDWREIPSEDIERRELKMLLQEAIAALPVMYREVLLLRDIEELNTAEVAEVLQISVASVKVRLHRARLMMQKMLAPRLAKTNPKRRWFQWS
jgi:RNA polymerase sigma-70 factor (ECF subfamily)